MNELEYYHTLLENVEDIVFVLDTEGRHVQVFGRWIEKARMTRDDFLGKTSSEVLGDHGSKIHEDANQAALNGEVVIYEWSASQNDGVRYYQTKVAPFRDNAGEIIGVIGIGRDITPLKEREAHQHENLLRFKSMVDKISEPIMVLNKDLKIQYVNNTAEGIVGYSGEELQGVSILKILTEESQQDVLRETRSRGPGEVSRYRLLFKKKDGSLNELFVISSSLFDSQGEVIGFYGHLHEMHPKVKDESLNIHSASLDSFHSICSYCKKINTGSEGWQEIESFLFKSYGMHFSHGICPTCMTGIYKELKKDF